MQKNQKIKKVLKNVGLNLANPLGNLAAFQTIVLITKVYERNLVT